MEFDHSVALEFVDEINSAHVPPFPTDALLLKSERALRMFSFGDAARFAEIPAAKELYKLCCPVRASSSCSMLKAIGSVIFTSWSSTYAIAPSSFTAAKGYR